MTPETVEDIISSARTAWPFANDIEITLEANPTSVEASRFQGIADAGVNRVSIGVQALNDSDLRALGRLHSADEARAALDVAHSHFDRVSFDLIYARQEQSLKDWERELADAIMLADGHMSLYQLTIEEGTAFGDRFARGRLGGLPGEDLAADMYELTQHMTEAAGLPGYEISNHAAPGQESRHNLVYWRGHDWLGVGPGAHGRFTSANQRIATEAYSNPGAWLEAVRTGSGETSRHALGAQDSLEEMLMMGLRLSEGVPLDRYQEYSNKFIELADDGLLQIRDGSVSATALGKPLLNAILRKLLA
jgi:oxygen-independent coproporphyrinogen-3 oxidase